MGKQLVQLWPPGIKLGCSAARKQKPQESEWVSQHKCQQNNLWHNHKMEYHKYYCRLEEKLLICLLIYCQRNIVNSIMHTNTHTHTRGEKEKRKKYTTKYSWKTLMKFVFVWWNLDIVSFGLFVIPLNWKSVMCVIKL